MLLRSTPLYDALVDEYRMALRSLPGDRSGEDAYLPRYASIPAPYNPNSRHRGVAAEQPVLPRFRY